MRTIAAVAAALMLLLAVSPTADAKRPSEVRRAAHKLHCHVAGPARFEGPRNRGVICWQSDHKTDRLTDGNKTYVLRYRNTEAAIDDWSDFLAGQGCVARKGHVFVVPAGRTWYDCRLARKAARRLHGSVITGTPATTKAARHPA